MSQHQPTRVDCKTFKYSVSTMIGLVLLTMALSAVYEAGQKNPETPALTQEQLKQTILFTNKYPEIYNLAIYSGAKIVPKTDGIELDFENPPATVIENLIKLLKEKGLDYQIGYVFFKPNNLSDRGTTVVEIKNKLPQSNFRGNEFFQLQSPNTKPVENPPSQSLTK